MRRILAIVAAVMLLGMGFAGAAAAQSDATPSSDQVWEYAYGRNYASEAMTSSDSNATPDMNGTLLVQTIGFKFTDESIISDNFDEFADGFASGYFGETSSSSASTPASDMATPTSGAPQAEPVDDLGDQAVKYVGSSEFSGQELQVALFIWQQGEYAYVVSGVGGDEAQAEQDAMAFVDYISQAEPSDEDVSFSKDGTSTGGVFDQFPTADDTPVEGLVPQEDVDYSASI